MMGRSAGHSDTMRKLLAIIAIAAAGIAPAATNDWFPFGLDFLAAPAPAFDLSALNEKPAGRSGWLRAEGERLVDDRGETVRLLGLNLTAKACFPAPADAAPLARALARYGCNLVRLHLLDNTRDWGDRRLSLLPASNDPIRDGLETNALARLDAFVAALKAEGVRVNLNLHVGRVYPGDPKLTENSKGIGNFMPDMVRELKEYARLLLSHVNPHTGLAYRHDPAVAIVEITGEDSLAMDPWWIERLDGAPAAELRRQFNAWLRAAYRDDAGLRAAWGMAAGGMLDGDGVALPRSDAPAPVRRDFFRFLAGVEIAFASELKRFLREELGCRALISHSHIQCGGPLGARREHAVSDFADIHGYWQHPGFPRKPWDPGDWVIGNESQLRSRTGGILSELAMLRPAGRAYSVSEYDIPAPSDYAAELWPVLAAMAGFQGWSVISPYTLARDADELRARGLTSFFVQAGHPAKLGFAPAGAAIFRLGLVAPARSCMTLKLGDDAVFDLATACNGRLRGTVRPLWHQQAGQDGALALRHRTALALTGPGGATGPATPMPAAAAQAIHASDTGEWTWDTTKGVFVLGAPAARVWSGEIGGQRLAAGDAELECVELDEPGPVATVALVALDGQPVAQSARLLVTALRRAENAGMEFDAPRRTVGHAWGQPPARVLGLHATLKMPAGTRWIAQPLDESGQPRGPAKEAQPTLAIRPEDGTIWWLLTRG